MAIRIKQSTTYEDGKTDIEAVCLSTDAKPTDGIATGSIILEADTGDMYVYDETGETWTKM